MRLDVFLVEQGYVKSRESAKRAILDGRVRCNGVVRYKPALMLSENDRVDLEPDPDGFVSRGGLKLERAVESFSLSLSGKVCMDIGASCGGFTDCMLRHGAARVYAVDVGCGQLDKSLRADARVVNMEKTDVRAFHVSEFSEVSFVSCDVSFISLSYVLPTIAALISAGGEAVLLIKPQFEAGRSHVKKGGIVKDKKVHEQVIASVLSWVQEQGCTPCGLTYSPLCKGNR